MSLEREKLFKLKEEIDGRVSELEQSIYESVGHEFNINSPKQLADVLFNELELPKSRKLSTKESITVITIAAISIGHNPTILKPGVRKDVIANMIAVNTNRII